MVRPGKNDCHFRIVIQPRGVCWCWPLSNRFDRGPPKNSYDPTGARGPVWPVKRFLPLGRFIYGVRSYYRAPSSCSEGDDKWQTMIKDRRFFGRQIKEKKGKHSNRRALYLCRTLTRCGAPIADPASGIKCRHANE